MQLYCCACIQAKAKLQERVSDNELWELVRPFPQGAGPGRHRCVCVFDPQGRATASVRAPSAQAWRRVRRALLGSLAQQSARSGLCKAKARRTKTPEEPFFDEKFLQARLYATSSCTGPVNLRVPCRSSSRRKEKCVFLYIRTRACGASRPTCAKALVSVALAKEESGN